MTAGSNREEIAAEWVVRLQSASLSEEDVAAWMAWCEADPLNRKAFDAMEEVWSLAGKLDTLSAQTPSPVLSSIRHSPAGINLRAARTVRVVVGCAAAAALLLVAGISLRETPLPPGPRGIIAETPVVQLGSEGRLETERGHMTTAQLEDGSRVELGAHSALTVRYTAQTRSIIADQGEAFFDVAKSRERPFVVQAGAVTVTAVGTAFSVAREDQSVAVAVTEGLVEIKASPNVRAGEESQARALTISVAAGQRVLFEQGRLAQSSDTVDSETALSRREGRLEFRDEPLRLAVARVSRYTDRDITVADRRIDDLRVTGTAYVDRVDAWLEGIEAVLPVKAQRLDERHILIKPAS